MVPMIVIAIALLLLASAFFSCSETAFTAVNHAALHRRIVGGDARAALARRFMERMDLILGTILVGNNIVNVSAATLAALLIDRHVSDELAPLMNTVIMTPLILLFAELVPKSIAFVHANALVPWLVRPLRVAQLVVYPVVWATAAIASLAGRLFDGGRGADQNRLTREDMHAITAIAAEEGVLPEGAVLMMQTVLGLGGKPMSAVMKPLVDVVAVRVDGTVGDVEDLALEHGYSRYPVFDSRIDDIIGVVDVRQILYGAPVDGERQGKLLRSAPLNDFIRRDLVFVPETKPVRDLLQELHFHRLPIAAVVDEHGGVTGIVTTEDLIEEVVGEIMDERDDDMPEIKQTAKDCWECDGRVEIDVLSETLGHPFKRDDFSTVAGLVLKLAGKIPEVGDTFATGPFQIQILKMDRRRVAKVKISRARH